ncbi:MAG TPA: hypothetical protein VMU11_01610 [Verrucomicrobiae bacterium]|nr:hypothetical protein [Verrucomicrobiae bacterium]
MNKLIALFVSVVALFVVALPAHASDMTVIVNVDQARLNREIGRCDGGRSVAVTIVHHTLWSPPGVTAYTVEVPTRDMMGGMPVIDVNVFCGDHRETNLAGAVDVAIRN